MESTKSRTRSLRFVRSMSFLALVLSMVAGLCPPLARAATTAPVSGEIQLITLNDPADVWSGGTMVVGGQNVIIPRNLLMDLPANRLTLQQLFAQAPAECVALGQSGLAKGDTCNTTGTGGWATISANRTVAGDVIAGDVFIEKGRELVTGIVTYINYTDGYLRVNGLPNDPATGAMIRLNDPDSRHTVQQGLGCAGGPNCSADPRFTLDPDNYVITFTTGYPACIPSTVSRSFTDLLGSGVTTSLAGADGSGDFLCPTTNRPVNNRAADSRRFAPIMVLDSITAEGNFEVVNGVQFLSAYALTVNTALTTGLGPDQPDYLFLAEMEMDASSFNNERARTLFIGFTTLAPADVLLWSIHYDPANNLPHEFPLASVRGCDTVGGGNGTCTNQGIGAGIAGGSGDIFKIRYDLDFRTGVDLRKPELNPCPVIGAEPRFPANVCPDNSAANNFAILSPVPHEIMARTGHKIANPGLVTVDIIGNEATNGQYLFPLGANLGGIGFPEFVEIDLNAVGTAFPFSGIPWNLDRRLSPGGCDGPCEGAPQPLDPFPFEGYDPRFQGAVPPGPVGVSFSNNSPLQATANRIISYVDGNLGKFDGDNTVLAWPPGDPPLQGILPTATVQLSCTGAVGGGAPAQGAILTALPSASQTIGQLASFSAQGQPAGGVYEYRFWLNSGGIWSIVKDYSPDNIWIWNTSGLAADGYQIQVDVRAAGSTSREAFQILDYALVGQVAPAATQAATRANLTASPTASQTVGQTVTFSAEGLPAGGAYEYRFWLRTGSVWQEVQAYSASSTWTWNPSAAGSYSIQVDVRAIGSAFASEAARVISYTIN